MNQLKNVKLLLLINFIIIISLPSLSEIIQPPFDCGLYQISGFLKVNSQKHFILTVNNNTTSPFEFILLGGSFTERLSRNKTMVETTVYTPKEIINNNTPIVYLRNINSYQPGISKTFQMLSKMACGKKQLFKQLP